MADRSRRVRRLVPLVFNSFGQPTRALYSTPSVNGCAVRCIALVGDHAVNSIQFVTFAELRMGRGLDREAQVVPTSQQPRVHGFGTRCCLRDSFDWTRLIMLHQGQILGPDTAWSVPVQFSLSVYISDHRRAKGWADMCRPVVQSSYRVSCTNRARPDHDEFFARFYFVSFSSPSSSAVCEHEQFKYRHLGSSEAGEDMALPGGK